MIRTLKAAFGLGLLAALAMSAMSVMSASAITSGHFTSDAVGGTTFHIEENTGTAHVVKLHAPTLGRTIECHHPTYKASTTATTTQVITVEPEYTNCTSGEEAVTVTMNGCDYTFTSRSAGHATTHFKCPVGKVAEIHSPNGTFTFGAQTPGGGATYTTITDPPTGKHAITANITATGITYECHGLCAIFGTTGHNGEMTGSVTITGKNHAGQKVNITAT